MGLEVWLKGGGGAVERLCGVKVSNLPLRKLETPSASRMGLRVSPHKKGEARNHDKPRPAHD